MNFVIICGLFFILIFQIFFLLLKYRIFIEEKKLNTITNFKDYLAILQYHMDKAYSIIYKDKILIYSTEAIKITDKQFSEISKYFANLTLKMIGPSLKNEIIILYGNEETLFFNIIEYFHTKYEEDEIQKTATEKMMEKDIFEFDKTQFKSNDQQKMQSIF